MKPRKLFVYTIISFLVLFEALSIDGNEKADTLFEPTKLNFENLDHHYKVYASLMSAKSLDPFATENTYLTTLIIRNNSELSPLYVGHIDYYDADGNLIKQFINQTFSLKPLKSIRLLVGPGVEYNKKNTSFIIELGSDVTLSNDANYSVKLISKSEDSKHSFKVEGVLVDDMGYVSHPEY